MTESTQLEREVQRAQAYYSLETVDLEIDLESGDSKHVGRFASKNIPDLPLFLSGAETVQILCRGSRLPLNYNRTSDMSHVSDGRYVRSITYTKSRSR